MTTEHTPSADEDHVKWLKVPEGASSWGLFRQISKIKDEELFKVEPVSITNSSDFLWTTLDFHKLDSAESSRIFWTGLSGSGGKSQSMFA